MRASLLTPAQVQFDLRVLKLFKIGEHEKLDFVVELFKLVSRLHSQTIFGTLRLHDALKKRRIRQHPHIASRCQ